MDIPVDNLINNAVLEIQAETEGSIKDAIKRSLLLLDEARMALKERNEAHCALIQTIRDGTFNHIRHAQYEAHRNGR